MGGADLGGADFGGGSLPALETEGLEPSERGVRGTPPPVGVVVPASGSFRLAVSAANWEGLWEGGGIGGGGGFQTESKAGEEGPEEEGGWGPWKREESS